MLACAVPNEPLPAARPLVLLGAGAGGGHRSVMAAITERLLADGDRRWQPLPLPQLDRLAGAFAAHAFAARSPLGRFLAARLCRRIVTHLALETPPALLVLHPSLTRFALRLRAAFGTHARAFAVCTDPGGRVRAGWCLPGLDGVFAPSDAARRALVRSGVRPERVHVTGLPVRQRYFLPPALPRTQVLRGLGLDPARPVALLVCSSNPAVPPLGGAVLDAVLAAHARLQAILVCPREPAQLRAAVRRARAEHRLAIVGRSRELELLLAAADLLLASPGGCLVFEAQARGVPFVAWLRSDAPPERVASAAWVQQTGRGRAATDPQGLRAAVRACLQAPRVLQRAAHPATESPGHATPAATRLLALLEPVVHAA